MALGGVTLSYGLRSGLSALRTTNSAIDIANLHLSTGKRINSPLDNAVNYFTAQGLSSRAKSMALVSDNIALGLRTFEAANKGLESIKTLLEAAAGQLRQAQQSGGTVVKIVSAQTYLDPSGDPDPTTTIAGTGTNDISLGDNFSIALAGGVIVAAQNILTSAATAATTVQNFLDGVNNNATLNPTTSAPRVRAYLNEAGNIVIESARSDINLTLAQVANANNLNVLSSTFTIKGDPNTANVVTGAAGAGSIAAYSVNNATRAAIAAGFRTTLDQITALSRDAGYNGTNLLDGDTLKTNFNVEGTTSLSTKGVTANATYFGFTMDNLTAFTGDSVYGFQSDREIKQALDKMTAATDTLTALQSTFSQNLSIINMRKDFTSAMIKTLDEGADDLVAADINEEGANLTALQTRQALAVQALSLASESDRAILRLF